jgi:retinol dehydrogenase 12
MEGKLCIVTGANSGVGKVTARELARKGATVIAVSRDERRGEEAVRAIRAELGGRAGEVSLMQCDFASQRSIRDFSDAFHAKYDRLDVLVNNAGAILGERTLTVDGYESTFAVNHLGYFLVTNLLLDLLKKSAPSRIVVVASEAHRRGRLDFDDLQSARGYSSMRAYGTSKLCNILFALELSKRLTGTGVTVNSLHPGVVATNFGSTGSALVRFGVSLVRPFLITAEQGAETQIHLASSPEVEGITGAYWKKKQQARPTAAATDIMAARRLWDVSEELTGLGDAPVAR